MRSYSFISLLAFFLLPTILISTPPRSTSIATFKSSLINSDGLLEDRVRQLKDTLKNSKVDIICLQDIFYANVQRHLAADLRSKFPYAFSAQDLSSDHTVAKASEDKKACLPYQLRLMQACVLKNCRNASKSELDLCILKNCSPLANSFGSACRDCIFLHSGMEILCIVFSASQFETNFGLLLLSRKKLWNTHASPYNPQSQFRGYLEASIDGVGDVICTQTTAQLHHKYAGPPLVYPTLYKSYNEQHYSEIVSLLQVACSKDVPIILGNFNHGPASPGHLTWELPFQYGLINARGFYSPYVLNDGQCTCCNTSILPHDAICDHIYIPTSLSKRVLASKRIFDNNISSGGPKTHYGVQLSLKDEDNCKQSSLKSFQCVNIPFENVDPDKSLHSFCSYLV